MSIKIPYKRKDTSSTILTIATATAAIALVLLSSPILSFNVLLQPVQAANEPMTFRTPTNNPAEGDFTLTFDAQGTNSSGKQTMSGTFQITNDVTLNGKITSGSFTNNTNGGLSISGIIDGPQSGGVGISTQCSTDDLNMVTVDITQGGGRDTSGNLNGVIECTLSSSSSSSSQGGGGNATGGAAAAEGGNQSEVRLHLQEARNALQNNDTQGAKMHLDVAMGLFGGSTQGNMTSNTTTTTTAGSTASLGCGPPDCATPAPSSDATTRGSVGSVTSTTGE